MTLSPEILEWIQKAEGDYRVTLRELDIDEEPVYASILNNAWKNI